VFLTFFFFAEKGDGSRAYGEGSLPAGHCGKGKQAKLNSFIEKNSSLIFFITRTFL